MLNLVLVEAALETVPRVILGHPSVRRNARRRRKIPQETLLDRSLHHSAMERLPDSHKRGRPDIVHICLLEALGTPLNAEGGLRIWVHTYGGYAIEVSPKARLPRDRGRFDSLVGQLFSEGRVPPGAESPLMALDQKDMGALLREMEPVYKIALTSRGEPSTLEEVCDDLVTKGDSAVLVGAFPHGPMRDETLSLVDRAVSVHPTALETWVVTSRLIYEYERRLAKSLTS